MSLGILQGGPGTRDGIVSSLGNARAVPAAPRSADSAANIKEESGKREGRNERGFCEYD